VNGDAYDHGDYSGQRDAKSDARPQKAIRLLLVRSARNPDAMKAGVNEGSFVQGRLRFEDRRGRPSLQFVVNDLRPNDHGGNGPNRQAASNQQSDQAETYLSRPKRPGSRSGSFQFG